MLSRVAEAIFWMSRYLERAENIARFIDVNWHMSLDHRPNKEFNQWEPLVKVTGDEDVFAGRYNVSSKENVIRFLTLDTEYPNSIISCLRAARENARTVREIIPVELWEQINTFHHMVENIEQTEENIYDNPYDFCDSVKLRGMMLGGIANDTMNHGEEWHFFRLGRLLERADKTSRILDVKYFILLPDVNYVGTAYDDTQWAALLRTTDALNAYRQRFGRISPEQVVEFLMLDRNFPRAILYCLLKAQQSLHSITETPLNTFHNPAEQRLGKLAGKFAFLSPETVMKRGLHEFTDHFQTDLNEVGQAIAETFFGYTTGSKE
ncbi:MAG: alpha-E domain-containing protein [Anaerolineae bacterium]